MAKLKCYFVNYPFNSLPTSLASKLMAPAHLCPSC
uniref:Uncharacterized protein n=1 Tax=Anguilla anguilla TaxID=7936 RepID=A0A0E9T510_ANGAN